MKKALFFLSFFLLSFNTVKAEDINLYFFRGDGCPHCANEEVFLEELVSKYPELKIYDFEVWKNRQNAQKMQEVVKYLNADVRGVPFTIIGDKYFVGFGEGITDRQIENKIIECKQNICDDPLYSLLKIDEKNKIEEPKESIISKIFNKEEKIDKEDVTQELSLPIIGEFNPKTISLPFLTIVIGLLDGFNPCAMWILIFLITLLVGMKDRKKRWILGFVFIITSGAVYFMFMSLWLNIILFLGFILWVRYGIGVLSIVSGYISLKSGIKEGAVCKISDENKNQKIMDKIKSTLSHNSYWLSIAGIMAVAFSVNLIELMCSAGFPAVYTQVLTLNNLPIWQYYGYLSLYVLFFVFDDLLVFVIAMKTLEVTRITTKYSKMSKIIGGTIMIILGILLLLKPEWLMFG